MSGLRPGQTVYVVVFKWPDGSTSWAAVRDGVPAFTQSLHDDDTSVFLDGDDAQAFIGTYGELSAMFAAVERCTLRALAEDE